VLEGPFRGSVAVARGSVTKNQLRGPRYVRLFPDIYVRHELRDRRGVVVARFDLAYPDALLAIEYDGLGHQLPEFTYDDRWRDNVTGDHGWHPMRFGYADVTFTQRDMGVARHRLPHSRVDLDGSGQLRVTVASIRP
jgi:hypothetical protein